MVRMARVGGSMQVGSLVKIKQSKDPRYLGELAVVIHKGTWSVDVHIFSYSNIYQPRFAIEDLEVVCK